MATYREAYEKTLEYFEGDTLATEVFLKKYALRDGDDYKELTPDDMHRRLAKEFARIEAKYPNPMSEDEIYELFKGFKYVVPQGSPMSAIGNPYQVQSLSNCFTIESPYDAYSGILKTDQELVQLAKRRGGIGFDISNIRPKGLPTQNAAGTTDGIALFMDRYSNSCREVAQSGRRGALMLTISVHHPEIRTFINIKRDRTRVTGANISIRLSDEFMQAVKENKEVELRWPVDAKNPKVSNMVDANEIWDEIIDAAWTSAEPGLLFWDNVLKNGPADIYPEFRSVSVNPCCIAKSKHVDVVTLNGVKELKSVTKDDLIWVPDEKVWAKTTGYFDAGYASIYRVSFTNGSELFVTNNHKFFTSKKQLVELCDLKKELENTPSSESGPTILDQYCESVGIEKIEYWGEDDIGCIEVEKYHRFVANGVVSGNSEITLNAFDSCRLTLLNLTSYVVNPWTQEAEFDSDLFVSHVEKAQRLMDDMVDLELESIDRILRKINSDPEPENVKRIEKELWLSIRKNAYRGRRTGLGITGLGDCLAMLGIKYGSEEAIEQTEFIYHYLAQAAHIESLKMAEERDAFPAFNYDLEKDHFYLNSILNDGSYIPASNERKKRWQKYGRRNISLTTTAPAGSVSILTQTTSGIEPAFALSYTRRRKINPDDKTSRVDFVDELGDRWQNDKVYHHKFKEWMDTTGKSEIEDSPYFGGTAMDIDWVASVKLQAAAQKWVDHAISKTCNLPKDVSKDVVAQVYMSAWESGLKGFTVYRDGCRSGVLVSDSEATSSAVDADTAFAPHDAPKRPESLECDIHQASIKGEKWTILVGLMNGKPYEVFGGLSNKVVLSDKHKKGQIVKHARKTTNSIYDLILGDKEDNLIIKNIVDTFDSVEYATHTRLISLSLRHGASIQYVVEQLQKDKNSTMFDFSKVIARVLKKYIKDGTKSSGDKVCGECGNESLIYQEGCLMCTNCGNSKCG